MSRAHHADIGGMAPGSLPLARELVQEGLIIPPVRLLRDGKIQEDVAAIVCRNSRTPDERRGDLEAQIAAGQLAERRLLELVRRYGADTIDAEARRLMAYSERRVRGVISDLPRGAVSFQDCLDSDGRGSGPLAIKVIVEARADTLVVDFSGTDPECDGSLNAVESITSSAVLYVVQCLAGESVPMNHGCLAPLDIRCPLGSLVNARPGRAVSAGNVETSQRIVDVLFGAVAQLVPEVVPAASQGTMNNVMIGGWDSTRQRPFTYYETIAGGMGARPAFDGLSGVQVHMTNTLNTPIEALELSYPLRVTEYRIRRGSGGEGLHRGGDGVVRATQLLDDAVVTLLTERREFAPYGLRGGQPGAAGANWLLREGSSIREALPGKVTIEGHAGDTILVETPGGGGWGVDPSRANRDITAPADTLSGEATGPASVPP